jgi:chemotaxis protein MotB
VSSEHGGDKHKKHKKHEEHEEHEEHVNHEAWVIPYADLLTLLLAMFLALFAAANSAAKDTEVYKEKLSQYAAAFAGTMEGSGGKDQSILDGAGGQSPAPGVGGSLDSELLAQIEKEAATALTEKQQEQAAQSAEDAALDEIQEIISDAAGEAGLADKIEFRREERGLAVSVVSDEVLFASAESLLLEEGLKVLDGLAPALKASGRPVMIEGHTDSRPVSSSRYASNWELSTARATQVLRYLQSKWGIPPTKLSASGYADTKPLAAGNTEAAFAKNRRVEIVILATE